MSEQTQQGAAGQGPAYERCLCRELIDQFRSKLGVSPEVRRHLANSRIEFLKAIREVIDARIEHLNKHREQGTKVTVE